MLAIGDLSILADYFVLATGTSTTQVKALADEVDYQLSQQGGGARPQGGLRFCRMDPA